MIKETRWLSRALFACISTTAVVACLIYVVGFAQSQTPQTYVVRVNPDGSFTPQVTYIRSGDTVRWEQLGNSDSIVPVDGSQGYPAMCSARKAYNASDPNNFVGPSPFAPPGVYSLSPVDRGYIEATGRCPGNASPVVTGDNGKLLCPGGDYQATLDSTWSNPDLDRCFHTSVVERCGTTTRRVRLHRSSARSRKSCQERQTLQCRN